ncbi:hypothetical protein MNEG_16534 [Monoraphidium neglectum]|uniref:F-box/LRR-repeat protein 15/At3g58940/PEG3-like LRR domain-containing protein n=1 Tax=Monoraphidium neglectum TaxID=145388 RepID=A0A0D2M7G3_9CHLO|nr:hypothetical protein MNEG_16534 [Monoraphidium neglectum]KIY91430.1 hypothetical protein MNEG_16534 [Monoraphidium neglectum]|eukprot:XP_013890450.1 hypothetical protein MNEG_16534 [Monoraphidium neglectum]
MRRCRRLEVLAAPQCISLQALFEDAWDLPALRELNLFGCRHLNGVHLGAVLAGCPELVSLNVNGCWGIGALHLARERTAGRAGAPPAGAG